MSDNKEGKQQIYVLSSQAAEECGYIIAHLKNGKKQIYTAVYDSIEAMNKSYAWKDKIVLDIKAEDIERDDCRFNHDKHSMRGNKFFDYFDGSKGGTNFNAGLAETLLKIRKNQMDESKDNQQQKPKN